MKINLTTESGLAKLQATLDQVQPLSRTRTVTAEEIEEASQKILGCLGLSCAALEGVTAALDLNAQNFPNAYKGRPESTIVKILFSNRHWWVTDVYRGDTHRAGHDVRIRFTEAAKRALVDRFSTFGL